MVGWHHQLNGHEFEQTPGENEGQGRRMLQCMGSQRVGHDAATEQQLTSIPDYGKTIALILWTFVGKVISLLLNILSRFAIAFLSRSKCLSISGFQSPSTIILEPTE